MSLNMCTFKIFKYSQKYQQKVSKHTYASKILPVLVTEPANRDNFQHVYTKQEHLYGKCTYI